MPSSTLPGKRHFKLQRRIGGSGVVGLVFHRQQNGLRLHGRLQLDHSPFSVGTSVPFMPSRSTLHRRDAVRAILRFFHNASDGCVLLYSSSFGGRGLRDLIGILDGEARRRSRIGLRRSHQIVEAFVAAVEILVLLLDIGQRGLLAFGSQRARAR